MSKIRQIRPVTNRGEEVILEFDDTQALRALTEGGQLPALLILSRDATLIETARKAAPHGTNVTHAPDLDDIVDRLQQIEPGVLLVDATGTQDVAALLTQLTQHFPEMVAVVAGKREDGNALLRLTAEGRVFRFLLAPISQGQTRLALRAAAAQHIELRSSSARRAAPQAESAKKNYVATYGALAAGLVLVVAGVWFVVSKLTSAPEAPIAQPATAPVTPSTPLAVKPDPVQAELTFAQEAFAAGKYWEPRGESALDFYQAALSFDANNEAAKRGLRSVADKVLERAEADMTNERLEAAVNNVEKARDIDPSHPRLAFLDTQIVRERERLKLTQARGLDTKVRALVSQAEEHITRGRLIAPANANARDTLIAARKADPTDPLVVQSIRGLSATLTEEARKALAAGKTKDAQNYIDSARQLGSAGGALVALQRQIADATTARTPDPAPRLIPTVPQPTQAGTDAVIAETQQPIANAAVHESASAKDIGGASMRDAASAAESGVARQAIAARPISAVSLPRIHEVEAQYPRQAFLSRIDGWVDLEFTISPEGIPLDIEVKAAKPRRTFERAAVEALRRWRFQPVLRDGTAIAQRANLRMVFRPE